MKLPRRQFLYLAAGAAALIALTNTTLAQDWPTRPVTMVYPFAAGSSADVLGRLFASRLSELLGQPIIFENVGGAGGMTGSNRVAKAAPDGYQFVLGGTFMALNQTLYKNPLYNLKTDFTPIALIVEQPIVLIARKDLPANNLPEFIAYARANQAKMQYGSAGVGSAPHLACELLNAAIGVNITHVPYRGGGTAIQDLIASRIDYSCPLTTIAIPQIESKTVKAIAIFSKNRLPILPNLASAHEQGLSQFRGLSLVCLFLAEGHARADRAEVPRRHRRDDRNSGRAGEIERIRLCAGRTRAAVDRVSPESSSRARSKNGLR